MMRLGTIVAACALCATTAFADDLDLVAAGAAASQRGDHVAAAHLYLDSYARTLDPTTLVLIGSEYVRLAIVPAGRGAGVSLVFTSP